MRFGLHNDDTFQLHTFFVTLELTCSYPIPNSVTRCAQVIGGERTHARQSGGPDKQIAAAYLAAVGILTQGQTANQSRVRYDTISS